MEQQAGKPTYPITDADLQALQNSFTYHSPKDTQPARYEKLRSAAGNLALLIKQSTPRSREQSLAITKLEECIMWANKAIACNE